MHFAYPEQWWWCLLAVAPGLLSVLGLLRRRRRLRRLAEHAAISALLRVRKPVRAAKTLLIAGAAALLAIAALGPQWGQTSEAQESIPGRDLLILLDVSRSMLARDVSPSRLERARADIRDLTASLKKKGGYRVGLIAFADRAALLCPLTSDYRAFEEELARASVHTLRLRNASASRDGTQIGMALERAGQAVHSDSAATTDVLLISDGGDMDQDTQAAAEQLARSGIAVHTLGLGDPNQGALIPIEGKAGTQNYLTYHGEPVRVKLEESVLREVAQQTKGEYLAVGTSYLELDHWYERLVQSKASRDGSGQGPVEVWTPRFAWFLVPALAWLILEMLLGEGNQTSSDSQRKHDYFSWVGRRSRKTLNAQPV